MLLLKQVCLTHRATGLGKFARAAPPSQSVLLVIARKFTKKKEILAAQTVRLLANQSITLHDFKSWLSQRR